jgi:hypothetical protein
VQVLIMPNRDCQSDDDPSHILYFVEGTDRCQGAQERCGGQQGAYTYAAWFVSLGEDCG